MTDDPRTALATTLSSGSDDANTALLALRHAMAWAARSVAAIPAPAGPAEVAPIELVMAIDDALAHVDDLLAHVPALAEACLAGTPVTEYLQRQAQALAELSDRIAVARREHEALFALEAELRACGDEHAQVLHRVAELQRLKRLADSLPAVREQHDRLVRRLAAMISPAEQAEQALLDTADQVVTLSAERLADLGEHTGKLLAELEESEQRWVAEKRRLAEEEARLTAKRAEYDMLRAERDGLVADLRVHAEIDQDLAARLEATGDGTSADRVRGMLVEVQDVLVHVDQALAAALDRYDRFVEQNRKVLPWRDES